MKIKSEISDKLQSVFSDDETIAIMRSLCAQRYNHTKAVESGLIPDDLLTAFVEMFFVK